MVHTSRTPETKDKKAQVCTPSSCDGGFLLLTSQSPAPGAAAQHQTPQNQAQIPACAGTSGTEAASDSESGEREDHMRPKPSALLIAVIRHFRSLSTSLLPAASPLSLLHTTSPSLCVSTDLLFSLPPFFPTRHVTAQDHEHTRTRSRSTGERGSTGTRGGGGG